MPRPQKPAKSSLLNAIAGVLGACAIQASPKLLIEDRFGGVPEAEIARLRGARLITIAEAEGDQSMAAARIKALSGGEALIGRNFYEAPFSFKPRGKIILGTNGIPKMDAHDPALWRRLHLIRFTKVFTASEQDHQLAERLEAERGGILGWLLRGAVAWYQQGLAMPASVRDDVAALRLEFGPVGQFIAAECVVDGQVKLAANRIFSIFSLWSHDHRAKHPAIRSAFQILVVI